MIYEKDNVLKEALDVLVTVLFEGEITNKDYLGYWKILRENVIDISTASFKTGLKNFQTAMKEHTLCRDLMSYHFRVMTTLLNTNVVIMAADELFATLTHNLRHEITNDVVFDLTNKGEGIVELTGFERILLLFHIYQDRIDCALAQITTVENKGRSKR